MADRLIELAAEKHVAGLRVPNTLPGALVPILADIAKNAYIEGVTYALLYPWISVKEALPEDDNLVLVHVADTEPELCYCTAYYHDDAWQFPDSWYCDCKVTHWLPIPPLNP